MAESAEKELQLATGEREISVSPPDTGCELRLSDPTGDLEASKATLSKLLRTADDIMNLLFSADQLEAHLLNDNIIAEQLFKALKHICEHLTKLQPKILHLTGQAMCLESTGSITLMYKFHSEHFLSKEPSS